MKDLSESRILIVDDAKTNIDILVQDLREEYKLSVAVDGAAAGGSPASGACCPAPASWPASGT